MTTLATPPPASAVPPAADPSPVARPRRWTGWNTGLVILGVLATALTTWGIWSGSQSDYYASIALSMSKSWPNFFFGAFDPAGTVTLDKIPGSFWIPALFVKLFGFATFTIILPNALAAVGSALLVAFATKRLAGPTAGLIAGTVVATTPILIAVSRSNQPETFFVLGLALTAWAAVKAFTRVSFTWLMIAGLFIALSFQMYMIEAWAVWPALAAAWLCTRQRWSRRIWQTLVAGLTSAAVSVAWIVVVSLIPASSRPYIGSTLHNNPWEMVFGYNALGRFGSSTSDSTAYNSFTPPFSGDPGVLRLLNSELAGQIAWLIPAALLGVVALGVLRWRPPVTVFVGAWLVTFLGMFSAVAGMHQFYTASLAVPMAMAVGLAFGVARTRGVRWPQVALVGTSALTALIIGFIYGGYTIAVAVTQVVLAAVGIGMILRGSRVRAVQTLTAFVAAGGMLLTPAVWSVTTIANPSSINPVAGGVSDAGGFGGGGQGGGPGGQGAPGGQGGFGGGPGQGGSGQGGSGQGGPGNGLGQGAPGGTTGQGSTGGGSAPQGMPIGTGTAGGGPGAGGGTGNSLDSSTLAYLQQHQGNSKYLVAVFGAQTAAQIILQTDGASVLPIGGFSGSDPVPTLAEFQKLVADGDLAYVLVSGTGGGGTGGGGTGTGASSGTSAQIQAWVTANCTAVTASGVSGLYQCSASDGS